MSVPRIYLGFHSYGICPTQFVVDVARAMRYTGTIIPAVIPEQSCYVDAARNKIVTNFLEATDGTHLMMVDVDISFESDAILKTFTIMQSYHADLIYGNYALGNGANSVFGPPDNKAQEAAVRVKLEPNKVYSDIATGGTGWVMMTRELLLRMQKECEGPWHWFARDVTADGKSRRGEDITFGLRAWSMNPKPTIIATTAVLLKHLKNQGYFPDFMGPVAAKTQSPGVTIPNPYENDPSKYAIIGTSVIDLTSLDPDQLAKVKLAQEIEKLPVEERAAAYAAADAAAEAAKVTEVKTE